MTVVRRAVRLLAIALTLLAAPGRLYGTLPEQVQFNRDVRPILADKCLVCHGPDSNKREANLRLDVRGSAVSDREGVRAIVPGDISQSELVRRISSSDPAHRMPPPKSKRSLTPREIALLTKWVEQGATYQPHWAYIPIARPVPPAVKNTSWVANPVDQFILAQLEDNGLQPSPDTDPRTLARRLSFDLVGLPPPAQDVAAFVADHTPAAYGNLVDRLLSSPHYGERMATYWLDLVRFADTNGYTEDQHHNIYPYRDYVIRAFNDNMPFSQFTIEQLAGDLLPAPTVSQRIASGYNRLNKVSTETGSQEKEFVVRYAADRVRTTAATWMGATLGCAECHDHKFDPYSSKDFYSFAAFFADIESEAVPGYTRIAMPPEMPVPPPAAQAKLDEIAHGIAALHQQRAEALAAQREQIDAARTKWERAATKPSTSIISAQPPFVLKEWTPSDDTGSSVEGGQLRLRNPPGIINTRVERTIATGTGDVEFLLELSALRYPDPANLVEEFFWTLRQPKKTDGGISINLQRPFGAAITLAAGVTQNDRRTVQVGSPDAVQSLALRVLWRAARGEWSASYGLNGALPVTPFPGGPLYESSGQTIAEWTETIGSLSIPLSMLEQQKTHAGSVSTPFEFLLSRHVVRRHAPLDDPSAEIAAIRAIAPADRTPAQARALNEFYESLIPQLVTWNTQIDELEVRKRLLEATLPHTSVTVATTPRVTRILHRGDWQDENGEIVQPAVPAFLPALAVDAPNRLDLARWLVSSDNPLTARALVNRLWKLFFGHGIARSLDDLGAQGARPSHPELLDWLAAELLDSGWNVKHVIRLIVTSHTYRQSSAERDDLRSIDPENQLYARQSFFRLDAEMVRDNALAVSGLLTEDIGGASVKPYQPEQYWEGVSPAIMASPAAVWNASKGKDQYRRGVYTYWKRNFVHPSLLAFDAPTREECVAERPRSNTPLQALVLLNDPTYVEAARVLAERAARAGGAEAAAQLHWAFRQTLAREPEDDELTILQDLYDKHRKEFGAQPTQAQAISKVGFSPASWNGGSDGLAALTSVCRVLLNLNETITRY